MQRHSSLCVAVEIPSALIVDGLFSTSSPCGRTGVSSNGLGDLPHEYPIGPTILPGVTDEVSLLLPIRKTPLSPHETLAMQGFMGYAESKEE